MQSLCCFRSFFGTCLFSVLVASNVSGENSLSLGQGSTGFGAVAEIPVVLSNDTAIYGFAAAFEWDSTLFDAVDLIVRNGPGEVLEDADMVIARVEDSHMVLVVSMDADGVGCENIPPVQGTTVAMAQFRAAGDLDEPLETSVRFVDDQLSIGSESGALTNSLVLFGQLLTVEQTGLILRDGTLAFTADEPGPIAFACGGPLGDDGRPTDLEAAIGERVTMGLYYRASADALGDATGLQGLSMGLRFGCDLIAFEESLDLSGTALEQAGAEFVSLSADNDPVRDDGDGCELLLGVLLDSDEPFAGQELPPTEDFSLLASVDFEVGPDAFCGECLPIRFEDGVNGRDAVVADNVVSINFESRAVGRVNCQVCVLAAAEFVRGDCNFSASSGVLVNIADAAAIAGIFLDDSERFVPSCEDACDSNDDGRVDVADVMFLLEYLFIPSQPEPLAPGPVDHGPDPTADDLGCDGATTDC